MTADRQTADRFEDLIRAPERAAAYRWLAGIFARELSRQALAVYRTEDGRALLDAFGVLPGLAPLSHTLSRLTNAPTDRVARATALDLAGEFARLFHGVAGRYQASPCASFYRDPNGRMMQAEAGAMQQQLAALGFKLAESMREPPDHVAVQLAVMAQLVDNAPVSVQVVFLERNLTSWLGEFSMRCTHAPRAEFYPVAARSAADFCAADLAQMRAAQP